MFFRPAIESVPPSSSTSSDNLTALNTAASSSSLTNNVNSITPPSQVERGNSRRRSTRHRNYLNRSHLHNAVVELPDGYGKPVFLFILFCFGNLSFILLIVCDCRHRFCCRDAYYIADIKTFKTQALMHLLFPLVSQYFNWVDLYFLHSKFYLFFVIFWN